MNYSRKMVELLLTQKNIKLHELFSSESMIKEIAQQSYFRFEEWMLLIKYICPQDTISIMNVYAPNVNQVDDIRDAFEYATIYEKLDLLEKLLALHKERESLREWIVVYEITFQVLSGSMSLKQALEQVKYQYSRLQHPITRMRLQLIELTTNFQLGNVRNALLFADQLQRDLMKLNPCYTKSVTASRLLLLMGLGKLYGEGNASTAEEYLQAVHSIKVAPEPVRASSYHALSILYSKKNKEHCWAYRKKSIIHAKQAELRDYIKALEYHKVPFIKNLHGEMFELNNTIPIEEHIHQYVIRNNNETALNLIHKLENEGKQSPFMLYYKGKATKDANLLMEAIMSFSTNGRADVVPFIKEDIAAL
ncbi:hypothetical protein EIJ82_05545 [Alkalihalobacillus clausii]|nr:hypothetical protein [Shouchella clausii]